MYLRGKSVSQGLTFEHSAEVGNIVVKMSYARLLPIALLKALLRKNKPLKSTILCDLAPLRATIKLKGFYHMVLTAVAQ
jgi:hypothetical protein